MVRKEIMTGVKSVRRREAFGSNHGLRDMESSYIVTGDH